MLRDDPIARPAPSPEKQAPFLQRMFLLGGFWLFMGFALGTVLLLYPVRWWANLVRSSGWSHSVESGGVLVIILVLVVVSFALAFAAMKWFLRTGSIAVRTVLVLVVISAAGVAYWKWMSPSTMKANMGKEQAAGAYFTFGPYPDAARLVALREQGYTGVISLLHPAVVPFEPQLLARETREAAVAGIPLIHLPMLPWVSENTESLARLRALAASKQGRYYVHCYLGVDRVNVARRIVEQTSGTTTGTEGPGQATRRTLDAQMKVGLERGPIFLLEHGLYLTPYPTDAEFLSYILNGEVDNVVALLDPLDEEEKLRIDFERTLLQAHALPFHLVEIGDRYEGQRILEAVQMARKLPGTTVIHSFFSGYPQRATIAEGIRIAYRTGLPPLPPSMWGEPMEGGTPEVIAPHIATGPKPGAEEFSRYLSARGVRSALFVGAASAQPRPRPEIAAASAAGIQLRSVPADPAQVLELLKSGGPHYLYGDGVDTVKAAIVKRYAAMMQPPAPAPAPEPTPAPVAR